MWINLSERYCDIWLFSVKSVGGIEFVLLYRASWKGLITTQDQTQIPVCSVDCYCICILKMKNYKVAP